jgi:hypothetical protein
MRCAALGKRGLEKMRDPETDELLPDAPSNSAGPPAERSHGSRNKLLARFIDDLCADWFAHGAETIEKLRADRPHDYVRAVIAVLPRDVRSEPADDMTDEELTKRILELAAELGFAFGPPEGAARSRAAHEAPARAQPPQDLPPVC